MYSAQARPRCTARAFMALELFGRPICPIKCVIKLFQRPYFFSFFLRETHDVRAESVIDTRIVAAVALLASAGVPGQSKPCRWGAVTTCDVCNRRYWKCFVARQGSAAVPITHHTICQHALLATSQCPNLKSMIGFFRQIVSSLSHADLPYINIRRLCFGPE